jgi:hypothetical protein
MVNEQVVALPVFCVGVFSIRQTLSTPFVPNIGYFNKSRCIDIYIMFRSIANIMHLNLLKRPTIWNGASTICCITSSTTKHIH